MSNPARQPGVMRTSRTDTAANPGPYPQQTPVAEVDDEYRVVDDSLTENYDGYEA